MIYLSVVPEELSLTTKNCEFQAAKLGTIKTPWCIWGPLTGAYACTQCMYSTTLIYNDDVNGRQPLYTPMCTTWPSGQMHMGRTKTAQNSALLSRPQGLPKMALSDHVFWELLDFHSSRFRQVLNILISLSQGSCDEKTVMANTLSAAELPRGSKRIMMQCPGSTGSSAGSSWWFKGTWCPEDAVVGECHNVVGGSFPGFP